MHARSSSSRCLLVTITLVKHKFAKLSLDSECLSSGKLTTEERDDTVRACEQFVAGRSAASEWPQSTDVPHPGLRRANRRKRVSRAWTARARGLWAPARQRRHLCVARCARRGLSSREQRDHHAPLGLRRLSTAPARGRALAG